MSGLYSTQRWRKLRARFRLDCERRQLPCAICRQRIDYSLQHGLRRQNPHAWEPDHEKPARDRPDLFFDYNNLRPAHARCNWSRQASAIDNTWVQPKW